MDETRAITETQYRSMLNDLANASLNLIVALEDPENWEVENPVKTAFSRERKELVELVALIRRILRESE